MPDLTFTLRADSKGIYHATFKMHGEKKSQRVTLKTREIETARERAQTLGESFEIQRAIANPSVETF